MGGGVDYNNSTTETHEKTEASISSEVKETVDIHSGSEKEETKETPIENTNTITEPQNVSTTAETAPVSSPSNETSDTTEGKTTANAAQEAQITSQQNWEYEQSIKKEVEKTPLVCLTEDIQKLYQEYEQGSEVYRQKIMKLAERHSKIRRCRGDGNCFYRAFGFAWFERLMDSKDNNLRQSALKSLADTIPLFKEAGYQELVYQDIYEEHIEKQMKIVANGEYDEDMLLTIFQTDEISNCIVFYLRLITAAYLKLHREEYEPFLGFEFGMDQFCSSSVEAMDQEADHIHVMALTKALKVPVEIAYMSGSDAMEQVNFHEFYPDDEGSKGTVTLKPLVLLYRPGHYDILYRRE
ncbi:cysteine proteinase [Rhizophagus irregularis]|nr:cysteine proteinase [Rhizophagus irregularis]PKC60568.1 cysteine proteinase [Rhizophagus irregularis]PKK68781.1 cysteine proteinase [Rhizophagus irregularis]PKY20878.1 cysteine proteinase [Rhizophagus irregularis]PKY51516.1 cysteine proteinase [Rhizophagus irregularis]